MRQRMWYALIVFSIVFPIVAVGYEIGRVNPPAAVVYAVIIVVWGAVMLMAFRTKRTDPQPSETTSQTPEPRMASPTPADQAAEAGQEPEARQGQSDQQARQTQ